MFRIAAAAGLVTVVVAGVVPAAGSYTVYSQGGTNIGTASSINGGSTIAYVDNPNTNHPPNSDGVYNDTNGDTKYEDANGPYTVEFFSGPGSGYTWQKRDANGNLVDTGTMQPKTPAPHPVG